MLDESVKIFLKIHPEKIDWYKRHFPEEFFSSSEEALQYNSQRVTELANRQFEEQTFSKMIEEKLSVCIEQALEKILKDFK